MLEARNITINKKSEDRELIKNLSFTLNKNDKFAVIGSEGSGKSTLLKIINNMTAEYIDYTGEINAGKYKIGYLPQSISTQFEHETVLDFLLKNDVNSEIQPEEYQYLSKLDRTLKLVDFDMTAYEDTKQMKQFSGGEKVKLGLVKILLRNPDILLLDEPTNDLDLDTIIFLEQFIITESKPILYISHDERLLERTANGIIHLSQVKKQRKAITYFEKMGYQEYKNYRKLSLDSKEMVARKERRDYEKKMARFRQIFQKVEHEQNQAVRNPATARLLAKKMKAIKSQEKRYEREKQDFQEIPEREEEINLFFDQDVKIPNNRIVLDMKKDKLMVANRVLSSNIELLIKGPEKICIIGKNGTGKTTLLKEIYKILKQKDNLNVGYMSQNYDEELNNRIALDNVMDGYISSEEGRIRKMMGALHFTREEMLYNTSNLSGGQKAKLLLLKMVLNRSNVLILDEPTRNLSPLSIPVIHSILMNFQGAIISVSHDRAFIENVFEDIYVLSNDGLRKQ